MDTRPVGRVIIVLGCIVGWAALAAPALAQQHAAGTPAEMVTTYESLADAILSVKRTEANLVRSILGAAYAHAQVELGRARSAIKANDAKGGQTAIAWT